MIEGIYCFSNQFHVWPENAGEIEYKPEKFKYPPEKIKYPPEKFPTATGEIQTRTWREKKPDWSEKKPDWSKNFGADISGIGVKISYPYASVGRSQ